MDTLLKKHWQDRATEEDQKDSLSCFQDQFVPLEPGTIYLDGNSLGRMPIATQAVLNTFESTWGKDLIRGWNNGWIDLPQRLGAKIANLIGAQPDEVIVADSTSINLFKLVAATLKLPENRAENRDRILSDRLNFPSDLYIFDALAPVDKVENSSHFQITLDEIDRALRPNHALASFSLVTFKSGYLLDGKAVTSLVHQNGSKILWDLSHAAGAVPIHLNDWGVDLAVGCGYKYLNGGPGAPAYLYVRRDLQSKLTPTIQGWFGQKNPFAFGLEYEPADGLTRFLVGTPPVLSMAAMEPGIDGILAAGMPVLREKSVAQSEFLIKMFEEVLQPLGVTLESPRDSSQRGSHVSLGHPSAWQITQALINNHNIIPDFRAPNIIRIGITPIVTTFAEIAEVIGAISDILISGEHLQFVSTQTGVT